VSRSDEKVSTDVLIIGCGIGGSSAALELSQNEDVDVTVITEAEDPLESNTYYAQGGIIYRGQEDSPDLLAEDIVRAGAGINNPQAVAVLVGDGPRLLQRLLLDELHVPFDETPAEELEYTREAAHSTDRILHAGDATGRVIQEKLIEALRSRNNVRVLSRHTAIDLLTPSHHSLNPMHIYEPATCVGAYVFDQRSQRVRAYLAKKTILATGGLGQVFLHTTNPQFAHGDGLAMAARAGARIIHAEYVQFHPTAFYHRDAPRFLISEAVRGEGARLVDRDGRPFMQKHAPKWKDLAPRDVVARSIHMEMLDQGMENVYLDLRSHMTAEKIRERFPTIYAECLGYGVDITQELIPVVPAAHYSMGGVWVDVDGRASLRNLYAAGEVSCTGLHGANRLGSASLLEGLVWGVRAARDVLRNLDDPFPLELQDIPPWQDEGLEEVADPALIRQDMTTIKYIMWNYVGLVRSTHRLQRALGDLRNLRDDIVDFYRTRKLCDSLVGLRNSVQVALIIALAAWENKESRGCHYRED